ncbi:MAG: hypothetical protein ACPGRD_12370, partial [Planktomarina sp.]
MILLNAGLPRSGTILVNTIMRGILNAQKIPFAVHNPNHADLPKILSRITNSQSFKWQTHLIHLHTWDATSNAIYDRFPDHFMVTVNRRDPRDCAVSMAKLHELPMERAAQNIAAFQSQMAFLQSRTHALPLRYEYLTKAKSGYIDQIAMHMGFTLTPTQLQTIDDDTNKDKIQAMAQAVADGDVPTRGIKGSQRILKEHAETHINDRHIQS